MTKSLSLKQNTHLPLLLFIVLFFCSTNYVHNATSNFTNLSSNDNQLILSSLRNLNINGHFDFTNTSIVATDFGNIEHFFPIVILYPKTVSDISTTIKHIFINNSKLTITPRGHGHSFHGQSQNQGGIVIRMEFLKEVPMKVVDDGVESGSPYVEVSGGELWINILRETLKQGFAPKSWIDYLNLTVGGTLSNGGIGGQVFRHGPQISNVYQLEVVTGKGDIVTCSEVQNPDLFYGTLGGLGQFGVITKARISLEKAPKMVNWIRVLYSNFSMFVEDQEQLISSNITFDYIEGFVMLGLANKLWLWSSAFGFDGPKPSRRDSAFFATAQEGTTLYCLEVAKYFDPEVEGDTINQDVERLLSWLNYIPHSIFRSEVSYADFLDRIHLVDLKLQGKDMRNVTNPWFTLLIPKSKIHTFAEEVFGRILANTSYGPILLYPFNQTRWKDKTSMVTPDEEVIYFATFLQSVVTPPSAGSQELVNILLLNKRIQDFCERAKLGVKHYAPNYDTQLAWQAHFGSRWDVFSQRKTTYDPKLILTPEQRIFVN